MTLHPLAGKPAPESLRLDLPGLIASFYTDAPDPDAPEELVAFGTSGHRGSSLRRTFNEAHIVAITAALIEVRRGVATGPLFVGADTHALSTPALRAALEVLSARGVEVILHDDLGPVPTPVISRAVLRYNRGRTEGLADGLIITPSHNPPADGGIKYNPPHGGPADSDLTGPIQARANALLRSWRAIPRLPWRQALAASTTHRQELLDPYIEELSRAVDLESIAGSGLRLGAAPLGGASVHLWERVATRYRLNLEVVNPALDPAFLFMCVDHDGQLRMDCSSPWAMASLVALRERFDVAFGNDPDADRHGIVTPEGGLLNPNHFLAAAADYLLQHRPGWPAGAGLGKTVVTSAMLDRVAASHGLPVVEVPVGFKHFVQPLLRGQIAFAGEESAGASFLARDGSAWTTDKDGVLLALLAAEMTAVTGEAPSARYASLEARHGAAAYARVDAPADAAARAALKRLDPATIEADTLAGDPILSRITHAPGDGAAIGGLKVTTARGWFAARPSGTEPITKLYAESFDGPEHLRRLLDEAQGLIDAALRPGR